MNVLFSNIVSMLSLAELGFGVAVTTLLYKPLQEKNIEYIKSIIKFTKKIFYFVAGFMLLAGIFASFFIDSIIKDSPFDPVEIRWFFLLFLASSVVSYFNSDKLILLIADQKQYFEKIVTTIASLTLVVVQIVVSIITRNFYFFLLVQIFITIAQNIFLSRRIVRLYPYLKDRSVLPISHQDLKELRKNMLAMLSHKLGGVGVLYTTNIIISMFIGISEVGLFSNYSLIFWAILALCSQIFDGFTASIGNIWVTESVGTVYLHFKRIMLLNYWIYTTATVCLIVLIQPLIALWLGAEYKIDLPIVVILIINFYFTGTRSVVNSFKNTKGLFWNDRFKPIAEILVNLIVSLVLVNFFGLIGIFLGTTASMLFVVLWVEPHILFKYGLKMPSRLFFVQYFLMFFLTGLLSTVLFFGTILLQNDAIGLLVKLVLCIVVPNAVLYLIYRRNEAYLYLKKVGLSLLTRTRN